MQTYVMKSLVITFSLFASLIWMQVYARGNLSRQHSEEENTTWIFQGGAMYLKPDNLGRSEVHAIADIDSPSGGASLPFDGNAQLHLAATYMFADHFGLKLSLATPFSFHHNIKESKQEKAPNFAKMDIKVMTPALSMNYYPLSNSCHGFQPHIGMGVMYADFNKAKLKPSRAYRMILTANKEKEPKFKIDHTVGLAGEMGLDYNIDKNWSVGASALWAKFTTSSKMNSLLSQLSQPGIKELEHYSYVFMPVSYNIHAGYRF